MTLVIELLAPIIKFVILAFYEIREKSNEAVISNGESSDDLFNRKLM